jgi:preprotein translocase subunit SecF
MLINLAIALLIGIVVGTYSTIFLAAPMYAQLRERESAIAKKSKKALSEQRSSVNV